MKLIDLPENGALDVQSDWAGTARRLADAELEIT
jgi:hypothetical protein